MLVHLNFHACYVRDNLLETACYSLLDAKTGLVRR